MKQHIEQFACNLKADFWHTITDQATFGFIRFTVVLTDATVAFSGWELFMFQHGWLILLAWRICNAAIDSYKRIRDVRKPEWETQIKPILRKEALADRNLTFWQKLKKELKNLW